MKGGSLVFYIKRLQEQEYKMLENGKFETYFIYVLDGIS